MKLDEAKIECERWLSHLDRSWSKPIEMHKIASALRTGEIDLAESQRRLRELDKINITMFDYDGSRLEQAVRLILKTMK